jgi:valyl-tRNA synthetase
VGARPDHASIAVHVILERQLELEGKTRQDLGREAERQRLEKEIWRTTEGSAFTRGKLARPDFIERVPAEVVEKQCEKLAEQEALQAKLVAKPALGGRRAPAASRRERPLREVK